MSLLDGFTLQTGDPTQYHGEELPHGAQRLVAHLSLGRRVARTAVAGHLWPDVPDNHAHGSLRSALWRVQKIVPGLIQVSGESLSLADGVQVDVHELAAWARRVTDPCTSIDELSRCAVASSGDLLPGWYDDWVLLERERLRQLRLHAFEGLAERLAVAGRYGEAVEAAYTAVRDEPLRESAHRTVVRVHLAEGNLAEAVKAYEAFRTLLAEELGVVPTRQMRELVCRFPRHSPGEPILRPRRPAVVIGSADPPTVTTSAERDPGGVVEAVEGVVQVGAAGSEQRLLLGR